MFQPDAFRGRPQSRCIDISKTFPTLCANYRVAPLRGWRPLYAKGIEARGHVRWLTEMECARLQGFPAHHRFGTGAAAPHAAYHQLGNAVPRCWRSSRWRRARPPWESAP